VPAENSDGNSTQKAALRTFEETKKKREENSVVEPNRNGREPLGLKKKLEREQPNGG